MDVHVRWLIRKDMDDVVRIDRSCFLDAWGEEGMLKHLRVRNCIAMVAETIGRDQRILGFMLYYLELKSLDVKRLCVDPGETRQGVGTALIGRLKDKLSHMRRKILNIPVRESNLAGQFFLKENGLRAVETWREHYEDTREDAYLFRWTCESTGDEFWNARQSVEVSDA